MTPDDLRILIQEGEGTKLEFKEALSSLFVREIVARGTPSAAGFFSACTTPTLYEPAFRTSPATAIHRWRFERRRRNARWSESPRKIDSYG